MEEKKAIAFQKLHDAAIEVLQAAHGKNEYYSHEEALARFDAMCEMVTAIGMFTKEEIAELKRNAKKSYSGD